MRKTNELFFDGMFWSIVEKWNKSSKKDRIKTISYFILMSVSIYFSFYVFLSFIEVIGIISFFKLKNGNNQLHAWMGFSLFLIMNSLIVVFLLVLTFGALIAPFTS